MTSLRLFARALSASCSANKVQHMSNSSSFDFSSPAPASSPRSVYTCFRTWYSGSAWIVSQVRIVCVHASATEHFTRRIGSSVSPSSRVSQAS
eukprot:scaffold1172_cov247-Pinguiococcus_pyrenoidosus.AAC.19